MDCNFYQLRYNLSASHKHKTFSQQAETLLIADASESIRTIIKFLKLTWCLFF